VSPAGQRRLGPRGRLTRLDARVQALDDDGLRAVAELMTRLDPKAPLATGRRVGTEELRGALRLKFQQPRCAKAYLTFADPSQARAGAAGTRAARAEGPRGGPELFEPGVGANGGRLSPIPADGLSLDKVDNAFPHSEFNSRWVTSWINYARGAEDARQHTAYLESLLELGAKLDAVLGC